MFLWRVGTVKSLEYQLTQVVMRIRKSALVIFFAIFPEIFCGKAIFFSGRTERICDETGFGIDQAISVGD